MNAPTYKIYSATIPGTDQVLRRRSHREYTHVAYCPPFVGSDGTHYLDVVGFSGSEELAEKAAAMMGYDKVLSHWENDRAVYKTGARLAVPVIVALRSRIA